MVRNLGLVSDLTFADAHEEYPDSDLSQIYQEIFHEEHFANADILMLTGAPNNYEQQQRRETLIDYINEFSEDRNTLPILLTTSSQQKGLLENQRISQDDYLYQRMEPESSVDEIEHLKSQLNEEDTIAVFTNDYHTPRYEKEFNSKLNKSQEYIIFGTQFETEEPRYRNKWRSEAVRELIPQKLKDIGKKHVLR